MTNRLEMVDTPAPCPLPPAQERMLYYPTSTPVQLLSFAFGIQRVRSTVSYFYFYVLDKNY
jgi:hypothetical protein